MQDKRFYPYLFLHAGIVTLWVILDRTHKGIANDGAINLLSIAVLLCYFNLLYLHVMTSRREATISECGWNLLSVSFIAALMYDGFSTLYTGAFLVFAYMLDAIKKLYPKKNIFIDFTIDSEARIALKKDNSLEQTMQIIKELVNNVYKHAAASFIHLEIALNEESKLVITCQNDGAKSNDIENILSSKGGMLFLTVLINGNGGNIQYLEKDGILTATAVLGRKNEDITI